ncbi:hypothetical protein DFH28DRAFT_926389 [Melampsora americana]|nr:hypothetical protein DFH28DRAFT_926389 [Melampsora americana]
MVAEAATVTQVVDQKKWKASTELKLWVVQDQDQVWIDRPLPGKVQGINDAEGIKNYATAMKEACKHSRKKLHLLLMTNINNQKQGPVKKVPVPNLQALWHCIANKCGIINESVDSSSAWAAADNITRTRIAYLVSDSFLKKNYVNVH